MFANDMQIIVPLLFIACRNVATSASASQISGTAAVSMDDAMNDIDDDDDDDDDDDLDKWLNSVGNTTVASASSFTASNHVMTDISSANDNDSAAAKPSSSSSSSVSSFYHCRISFKYCFIKVHTVVVDYYSYWQLVVQLLLSLQF